jgi:hypothetical protein
MSRDTATIFDRHYRLAPFVVDYPNVFDIDRWRRWDKLRWGQLHQPIRHGRASRQTLAGKIDPDILPLLDPARVGRPQRGIAKQFRPARHLSQRPRQTRDQTIQFRFHRRSKNLGFVNNSFSHLCAPARA